MSIATAIYAKTESTDEYLYCVNGDLSAEEVQDFLRGQLDEEYDYIDYFLVARSKPD